MSMSSAEMSMSCAEIVSIILSAFALLVSIISIIIIAVQNRKLHNENLKLSTEPSLSVDLLFDSKIGGSFVKKNDGIDSLNVWVSRYSSLYVGNEIKYDASNPLFTVIVQNNGNAVANDICINEIKIISKGKEKIFSDKKILFESCSKDEKKANRICIDFNNAIIERVVLTLEYKNLLNQTRIEKFFYEADETNEQLRYIKREKNNKKL